MSYISYLSFILAHKLLYSYLQLCEYICIEIYPDLIVDVICAPPIRVDIHSFIQVLYSYIHDVILVMRIFDTT